VCREDDEEEEVLLFVLLILKAEDKDTDDTMRTMIINSKRQIIYQFPGSQWSAEDFLARLPEGVEG